jgi:hypothetical protein
MAKLGTSPGQGFAAFAGSEPSVKAVRRTNAATMEPNVISADLVRRNAFLNGNVLTRLKVYRVMAQRQGRVAQTGIFEISLTEYFSCEKIAGRPLGKAAKGQIRQLQALADAFLAEVRPPSVF